MPNPGSEPTGSALLPAVTHAANGTHWDSTAIPRRRPQKMNPYALPQQFSGDLAAYLASDPGQPPFAADGSVAGPGSPRFIQASKQPQFNEVVGSGHTGSNAPLFAESAAHSGLNVPASTPAIPQPHGSELFDAIVQAADPRHPDHAAWKDRYGTLANRTSRNSTSSQSKRERATPLMGTSGASSRASHDLARTEDADPRKRDSYRSGRRTRPAVQRAGELRDSDADDLSDASDAAVGKGSESSRGARGGLSDVGSSPRLSRTSSTGSAGRARRRRRAATEKGKARVPPLPIPPPRVTSSTRWQETYGSPASMQQVWPSASPALRSPAFFGASPALASTAASSPSNLGPQGRSPLLQPLSSPPARMLQQPQQQQHHRDTRPLPPLPREHASSPTARVVRTDVSRDYATADPASPVSMTHSAYTGIGSIDQSIHSLASVSAAHPSASSSAARLDAGTTAGPSPRGQSKTSEKGFFTFPRSMFASKSSQRSLDATLQSPLLSPPTPASPAVPRASYDAGSGQLRSMSKIQQILGSEVAAAGLQTAVSPPSGSHSRKKSIPRVPVPALFPPQDDRPRANRSMDVERTLDQRVFPMRRDEEFQAHDEFEVSESEDGMDIEPGASFLPASFSSQSAAARSQHRPGERAPGVVRRSLDSIISPFRAGLIASSSKANRKGPLESLDQLDNPAAPRSARQSMDTPREGRRSMSESRLVRPFMRQRPTKNGGRPLSRVNDAPEPGLEDLPAQTHSAAVTASNGSSSLAAPPLHVGGRPSIPANVGDADSRQPRLHGSSSKTKDDANAMNARHNDSRFSMLVDAGHTGAVPSAATPSQRRPEEGRTPTAAFTNVFEGQLPSTNASDRQLLPAVELFDGRSESRGQRYERRTAAPDSAMVAKPGVASTAGKGQNRQPSDSDKMRSRRHNGQRLHNVADRDLSDLSLEDKKRIMAQNTYFLPTKESRSRPPSANGSSHAHGVNGAPNSESQHSGAFHGSLASASSCRSLASSFSHSTSIAQLPTSPSANDVSFESFSKQSATPTSQSKGRFAGLFSRVKGSLTPGRTPPSASLSSFNSPASAGVLTPSQSVEAGFSASLKPSHSGRFETPAVFQSPSLATAVSPGDLAARQDREHVRGKKKDLPGRLRARSLASGRKKGKLQSPDSPETFENFISTMRPNEKLSTLDDEWRRKLLSEAVDLSFGNRASPGPSFAPVASSPQVPVPATVAPTLDTRVPASPHNAEHEAPVSPSAPHGTSSPPEAGGTRSFGKLLRKKKTAENLDEVIQSFVAQPPKMSHLAVAEEAAPRPSMSSTRGFDVTGPEDSLAAQSGTAPLTIRKTLSPALLSESLDVTRDSIVEEGSEVQSDAIHDRNRSAELPHSESVASQHDETEELVERDEDRDGVQAPLRRFIRRNASIDRLSRVDEASVKGSSSTDTTDSFVSARPSLSVPVSPQTRSFGEHRQIRRSVSGTLQPPAVPRALELGKTGLYEYGKRSMDVARPRNLDQLVLGMQKEPQPFPYHESPVQSPTVHFKETRNPRKSFGDSLSPSWARPSFNLQRPARTSFSQDRDRAPVASPISPPKNYGSKSPALVQAMKKLKPGKRSKSFSKGIGPGDVIIADFDDDDYDYGEEGAFDGPRPSMNLGRPSMSGPRPSMSGLRPSMSGGRPSMNLARPSINVDRKSFDTTGAGRSSLASAEMMTRLLEVHADAMVATPLTATFPGDASEPPGSASNIDAGMVSETDGSVHTAAEFSAEGMVGLGLGSLAEMPNASRPSLSASTSSGDLRGLKIADGQGNNLLKTPHAASIHSNGFVYVPKTPELAAFEDMLGKFGAKEKQLFKGISARVGTTPAQTPGLVQGESSQQDFPFGTDAVVSNGGAGSSGAS